MTPETMTPETMTPETMTPKTILSGAIRFRGYRKNTEQDLPKLDCGRVPSSLSSVVVAARPTAPYNITTQEYLQKRKIMSFESVSSLIFIINIELWKG